MFLSDTERYFTVSRQERVNHYRFPAILYRSIEAEKPPSCTHRTPRSHVPRSARTELTGSQRLGLGTGIAEVIPHGVFAPLAPNLPLLHSLSARDRTLRCEHSRITKCHNDPLAPHSSRDTRWIKPAAPDVCSPGPFKYLSVLETKIQS